MRCAIIALYTSSALLLICGLVRAFMKERANRATILTPGPTPTMGDFDVLIRALKSDFAKAQKDALYNLALVGLGTIAATAGGILSLYLTT